MYSFATPPPFPLRCKSKARKSVTRSDVIPLHEGPAATASMRPAAYPVSSNNSRRAAATEASCVSPRLVADNPGGKLNGARVNGNAILLQQQNFMLRGHADNNGRTGPMNPANKFPMTRLDQRQKFTGVKDSLVGLIHLISAAKHRAA